jgi:hypothetical protein
MYYKIDRPTNHSHRNCGSGIYSQLDGGDENAQRNLLPPKIIILYPVAGIKKQFCLLPHGDSSTALIVAPPFCNLIFKGA